MDLRQVWQAAMRELSVQLPRTSFDSWVRNLTLVHLDKENGQAILAVPTTFGKKRLEESYTEQIRRALVGVVGEPLDVQFIVEQASQSTMFEQAPANNIIHRQVSNPKMSLNGNNGFPNYGVQGRGGNGQQVPQNLTQYNNGNSFVYNGNAPARLDYGNSDNSLNSGYQEESSLIDEVPTDPGRPLGNRGFVDTNALYEAQSRAFGLNPKYVFDRYIVGSGNRLAFAAAKHVAENPGHSYNPLFIYGNVGLGKTHILHAIGHEALRLRPNLTVLYVSSEKFTNDLVNAIREHRMEEFRNRYRNIDILMIDDIQFIAGKDSTQEEFFHTFNALHDANKQIVLSSDRPPKAMLILEDRLRSRFEGGLISDIQPPDFETRLAILKNKAEVQPISIPEDVLSLVARQIQSNIRELEGALNRVVAFALHNRTALTVEIANQALNDLMLNNHKKILTPARIVDMVSQFFAVDCKELRGRSRSQDIVLPRQVAMYIIREQTETSLVEIGQELGGRDHTTVMHAIDKIEREVETNTQLRQQVNTIIQILYTEGGAMR